MKVARSTMVTAAVSAAATLAATCITYAAAVPTAAPEVAPPAAAPFGGDSGQGKGNEGRGNEDRGDEGRGHEGRRHEEEGRILVNERSYSSHPGDCITVVSGLGAKTLNIRNESHAKVEVFRGAVCDDGAPIATVGPYSSSFGVETPHVDGIYIENGIIASFRAIRHHEDD
ncbi:hypothetical protein GQF42_03650 [Streptomyces broussonetiae]|uniref:Uncharacterized protein n=2 Tax=Streptomyces broussonetiae TaxID=2686304 RepID=A0A6I6MU05_9ACTN|nr:hypothetical protein GQF42_03650 [Streptomyces broussonetiae]